MAKDPEQETTKVSKPPKPFRKPIKAKKYQRKLAGRIYLEPDREFLASVTTTNEEGRVVLSRELDKTEIKRLSKLRRAARKNKRGPRVFRLAILGVIVVAIVLFNLLFKNQLVTNGVESLLEDVFQAKADISGLQFKPLAGDISFDRLTIADAHAPMQNLFEMTTGSLGVDTWQLLNRHIIIDEIVVQGLQFGTARKVSGLLELVDEPSDGAQSEQTESSDTLVDRARAALPPISFANLGLPDTLDAQLFIEQNIELLATPVAVQTVANSATGFVARWESDIRDLSAELIRIGGDVTAFATTDFTAIRSVDAALDVYNNATEITATVTGITGQIESQYNALVAEATGILNTARSLPDQVWGDYEALLARIPDIRGGGRDFVVGLVTPYVEQALGDWYDRIFRAQEIYARITAAAPEREPRPTRRSGTDFDFADVARPRFLLGDASLGVGAQGAEAVRATVSSLTTDPDIVGLPTRITYGQTGRMGALAIEAVLDGQSDTELPLDLSVFTRDIPLQISRGLEALNVSGVTGDLEIAAGLLRRESGALEGAFAINATSLAVAGSYSENSIGEFVADLLESAERLEGQFAFLMADRRDVEFTSAQTNLDDVVAGAVRERIDSTVAAFKAELEERVTAYLDPIIASLTEKLNGIVRVEASAEELLSLARDREAAAEELERIARDSLGNIRDQLEAEARAALDAARAEAEARAQAVIDEAEAQAQAAEERLATERERAEAEARAAADRAAAEAEEAAREAAGDAAGGLLDRLPLGGRR